MSNACQRTRLLGRYFFGTSLISYQLSEPRFQAKGLGKCRVVVMHLQWRPVPPTVATNCRLWSYILADP